MITVLLSLISLLGCSQKITLEKVTDPLSAPLSEIKDLICGGGRSDGKWHDIGGNSCTMPSSTDQTCDRWGCAIVKNGQGDLDCPAGTTKRITDTTPVEYFVCILPENSPIKSYRVCGGTRIVGKPTGLPEECVDPVTSDNSCNRFGCAVLNNPTSGESGCPGNTTVARVSDNPTSILCLNPE